MSYKAPVSGQYITFPIDIQRCVEISWKENYVDCTAMYYTTRCFWGYRKDVPFVPAPLAGPPPKTTETLAKTVANKSWPPVKGTTEAEPTKKIDIRGSTDLFIAAEYFDDHYKGGSLADYHVKEKCGPDAKWCTLKLNENFHYGQNGDLNSLRRFIVYHPINPPKIFQHRFMSLKAESFIKSINAAALEMPPSVVSEYQNLVGTIQNWGKALSDGFKATFGHYLHQFLDEAHMEVARNLWKQHVWTMSQMDKGAATQNAQKAMSDMRAMVLKAAQNAGSSGKADSIAAFNPQVLDEKEMFVLFVALVEGVRTKLEDAASDEKTRTRYLEQMSLLQEAGVNEVKEEMKEKGSFLNAVFGFFSRKDDEEIENSQLFQTIAEEAAALSTKDSDSNALAAPMLELVANGVKVDAELYRAWQTRPRARQAAVNTEEPKKPNNIVEGNVGGSGSGTSITGRQMK